MDFTAMNSPRVTVKALARS